MPTVITKDEAEVLAPIIVSAISKHSREVFNSLDDDDKREMHPEALAALGSLAGIQGQFCTVAPTIVKAIDSLGWLAKMLLGPAYAFLMTFQQIVTQMQTVLCGAAATATGVVTEPQPKVETATQPKVKTNFVTAPQPIGISNTAEPEPRQPPKRTDFNKT